MTQSSAPDEQGTRRTRAPGPRRRGLGRVNLASRIDIDPRTTAGKALRDAGRALRAELPAQVAGGWRVGLLVDAITRTSAYVDHLDAGLLASTTLLTNRRLVKPALEARERLLTRLTDLLDRLEHLERLTASKPTPEPESEVDAIIRRAHDERARKAAEVRP